MEHRTASVRSRRKAFMGGSSCMYAALSPNPEPGPGQAEYEVSAVLAHPAVLGIIPRR